MYVTTVRAQLGYSATRSYEGRLNVSRSEGHSKGGCVVVLSGVIGWGAFLIVLIFVIIGFLRYVFKKDI